MFGIIFDCDGTLIDSEQAHFLSWQQAIQERGGSFTLEEYCPLVGATSNYIVQKLKSRLPADSLETLKNDKSKYYLKFHSMGIKPIQRTVDFVQKLILLKEKIGFKLAVASAAGKHQILMNLKNLNLLDSFDAVVSGSEDLLEYSDPEGVNKPKPYIYLHTAKLLGLEPKQCVAFEDSLTGIMAASRAGMTTFAVPNEHTKLQDLSSANYLIASTEAIDLDDFFKKIKS